MKTTQAQQINAFVDAELDLASQLEMEEQMRLDAGLREQVEGLRQLRQAIREGADYHAAPDALRRRITGLMAPKRPESRWRPMVASLAVMAVVVVVLNLTWWHASQEDRLLDDVVASHVRSTLGQHLVDVASSDHHTVKPWLSSKLDFSPPVSELRLPGSVLLGGRVDYLDGHPVATLVYRQGEHIVNAFVWPSAGRDSPGAFSTQRGFQTAHWAHGGMTHWVISDVNRDEFKAVVRAIQGAESDR